MIDTKVKDCIIIGGGIAGLQAAIQLGRYSAYDVLVIDRGTGRSTICKSYRNILGWPDGVSGEELRQLGRKQAETVGVTFTADDIRKAERDETVFVLTGKDGAQYKAKTLLLATGLMDRFPELPGLMSTLGKSVFVCPDCDGYEIQNRKTVVLGSGDPGASMAVLLSERTRDITYVNHEGRPASSEFMSQLAELGIPYVEKKVSEIRSEEDGGISAVVLEDGSLLPAERGFISFGGNMIYSELAEQLGAELEHNRHVKTDPRSKMTSVELLWAAGDLGVHSELTTVAMGEGATAAIWINKTLKKLTNKTAI